MVQVHIIHGEICSDLPKLIILLLIVQYDERSRQYVRSGVGNDLHGILGFVNVFGKSITCDCIIVIESEFLQMISANDVFLISASCFSLKRMNGSEVSNQNLSHFLSLENCSAIIHPNVAPTEPPCKELSDMPPEKRSMSSTCLCKKQLLTV